MESTISTTLPADKRSTKKQYNKWQLVLIGLIIVHTAVLMLIGLSRHWGQLCSINDLGSFDQVLWRAANGLSLVNTSVFSQPVHWLGFHFHPILYLLVPFYKILPSVNWLIFAQSFALSVTAWPIFRTAEQVTKSEVAALLWASAYLCNPLLLNAAAWDFHVVSIATPFLALALLAVEQDRPFLLLLACLIILSCKEHFGLAVAGLGLLYGIQNRHWLKSAGFMLVGVAAMLFIVGVVMPFFSFTGQHIMLSSDMGQLSRYGWLGTSMQEVLKNLMTQPIFIVQRIFLDMGGFSYLCSLLVPFLFLPLASPWYLLPAGGDLIINLLSANPMPRGIFSYHSVTIIPILIVAAIHGSKKLHQVTQRYSAAELAGFVLFCNLGLGYLLLPLPLPGAANMWQAVKPFTLHDSRVSSIQKTIKNASVSVQANIGSHFSQRSAVYRYPQQIENVDFIVLWLDSPTKRLAGKEKGVVGTLAHHLQMNPIQYLDSVESLLKDKRYSVIFWDSPWLVLKNHQVQKDSTTQILSRIHLLRNEWGISR